MIDKRYFAAFTCFFAVLAAVVFWGSWSPSVAFIAPDDAVSFPLSQADVWQRWWNGFLTTGKILPTDIFHSGLFVSPHFCRELKYATSVYLAAFALSWFLKGRGLSPIAAYGAGLFLGFSGYWLTLFSAGHAGWFIWMSYGVFAFGLVDRAFERGNLKYWLLLGLDLAWAGYEQPDLWLLFSAFTFCYFVYRLVDVRAVPWLRLFAVLGVFVLVSLPNFVSLLDVVKGRENQIARGETMSPSTASVASERDKRWEFVTNWSLPAAETLEFVWPRLNGDTSCPLTLSVNAQKGTVSYTGALGRPLNAPYGNYRQHSLYLGIITVLFSALGLTSFRREREVRFFAIAALATYLLSLGRDFELAYRCIFALPAGDLIRCPVKWHHLTELSVAVLSGYGIAKALALTSKFKWGQALVVVFILLGALNLALEARRYCAPVDYSAAIAKKCSAKLIVLSRGQFSDPQVAAMVRAGYIVSVANWLGSSDAYLVQILEPARPVKSVPPNPIPLTLGIVSLLTAIVVLVSSVRYLK